MAIVSMRKITVCALKRRRKEILEFLQRRGVLEIIESQKDDVIFKGEDTASKQGIFLKNSDMARNAWQILDRYVKAQKGLLDGLSGRKQLSSKDYYTFVDDQEELMRIANEISSADKKIAELRAEIIKKRNDIDSLSPWLKLDIPLRFKGTQKTAAFIGAFPQQMSDEQILCLLAEKAPEIHFDAEVLSSQGELSCVCIFCHKKHTNEAEQALRSIGFSQPAISCSDTPEDARARLLKDIEDIEAEINEHIKAIEADVGFRNALRFMEDYYIMRAEKYEAIEKLASSKRVFILTGYATKEVTQPLEAELRERFDAVVEDEEAGDSPLVPTVIKNNPFSMPVESVVESYSMPKRFEVDPSFVMSLFYYVLFGIMFSDAGYGLVMTLGCAFALTKFKNMEAGLKRSIKMFLYCGISTIFWGLMFGSFFGDAITVISETFFGHKVVVDALWFNPVVDPMKMLMFSFVLGIIHLFAGLGILAFRHIRDGNFLYAVYDAISWMFIVGGAVIYLLSLEMMASITGLLLPRSVGLVGAVFALIGAVIVIAFAGRESRNPIKRVLKGLYGLYGVTSYLSDILSYSRLLALGLATGVIGQVFNKIASLGGASVFGVILFILVFIIGHALNIGINALGAYVHTNRLQFVEFFGKFYEGDGKAFKPFKINTKYYNIKEEITNE